jgi:hypothetical protein
VEAHTAYDQINRAAGKKRFLRVPPLPQHDRADALSTIGLLHAAPDACGGSRVGGDSTKVVLGRVKEAKLGGALRAAKWSVAPKSLPKQLGKPPDRGS